MAVPKKLTGRILDGSNNPISGVVQAQMKTLAFVNNGEVVPRVVLAIADATGNYAFDPAAAVPNGLYSNADMTPANSYWTIQHVAGGVPYPAFAVVIPNTAGPFAVTDPGIVVSSPALPAQYVTGPTGPTGPTGATGPAVTTWPATGITGLATGQVPIGTAGAPVARALVNADVGTLVTDLTLRVVMVPANGATDGANLTAKLAAVKAAGGGVVKCIPGQTYIIETAVIIPSGCVFDISGATLRRLVTYTTPYPNYLGQGPYLIQNSAVTPLRSVADAAMTSGSAVLTSATFGFTGADVGRTINLLAGRLDDQWSDPNRVPVGSGPAVLYTTILSVQSSTQATLTDAARSTVTNVIANIYPARDAVVRLVADASTTVDQGPNTGNFKAMQFRRIDTLIIDGGGMRCIGGTTQSQTFICPGDIGHLEADGFTFNTTHGGIQPYGPLGYASISHVQGYTADDLVAFQGTGWGWTQADGGDCEGPMGTIEISHVTGVNIGADLIHIWGGAPNTGIDCPIGTISIDHIYGSSTGGIAIEPYMGTVNARRIEIGVVDISTTRSPSLTLTVGSVESASLKSITLTPPVGTAGARASGLLLNGAFGSVNISDLKAKGNYVDWINPQSYYAPSSIDHLTVDKAYVPISTGACLLNLTTALGQALTIGQLDLKSVRAHIGDATGATALVQTATSVQLGEINASALHVDSSPGNTLGSVFSLSQATAVVLRVVQATISGTINFAVSAAAALDARFSETAFGITGQIYTGAGVPITRIDPTVTWGASTVPAITDSVGSDLRMRAIPTMLDWWKADAIPAQSDNTALATWPNSKSVRNMVQATGAKQPKYRTNAQNGLPAVTFDGISQFLGASSTTAIPTADATLSVFLAYKLNVVYNGVNAVIFDADAGGANWDNNGSFMFYQPASGHIGVMMSGASIGDVIYGDTTWHIVSLLWDGANIVMRVDGTQRQTYPGSAPVWIYKNMHIGAAATGASLTNITFGEALVYDALLTGADLLAVENYLRTKWGTL